MTGSKPNGLLAHPSATLFLKVSEARSRAAAEAPPRPPLGWFAACIAVSTMCSTRTTPPPNLPLDKRDNSAIVKNVDDDNAAPDQPPSTPDSVAVSAVRCGAPVGSLSISVQNFPPLAQAPLDLPRRRTPGLAL